MKLIILRSNLKSGCASLERSVVENNNLPILKNILLKADVRLTLQATNLELGATYQTSAKITEPGSISIPFGPLSNIIQNASSERISLESVGNVLTVKTDNYEAKIQGIAPEEFPIIPRLETEIASIQVGAEALKSGLTNIIGAAATNDLKPELNSILFDIQAGSFKIAATDGFRLAEKTFSPNTFAASIGEPLKALVPLKTIQEILRIFPGDEQLTVSFDQNQVQCSAKDITLISRLIDGTYPDYTAIIPKQSQLEVESGREELAGAVKLVSNFSGKASDVTLTLSGEVVSVSASSQLVGENSYQVKAKVKKGNGPAEIVFNWRYLLDGLRSLPGSEVRIGIHQEGKPIILRPGDDESVFYIVMPIQR